MKQRQKSKTDERGWKRCVGGRVVGVNEKKGDANELISNIIFTSGLELHFRYSVLSSFPF